MIMAGGTGGHVFPALAVADRLRALGTDVFWIGTRQGLEARVVPEHGLRMEWIEVRGLRGNGLVRWLSAPFSIARAIYESVRIVRRNRPTAVLGMGGFVSGPGGVASRLLGVPLVIHEQNALAGMTNRWLARIATRVMAAFPGSLPDAEVCGNPVRDDILALPAPEQRFAGRSGPLRLLVLGGSQGAQALNEVLPRALADLPGEGRPEVWHQAGSKKIEQARAAYEAVAVEARIEPFIDDMAAAYGWADLVFCRAGALTVAELAAAGIGAMLVPYPYAVDDHQTRNAAYLTGAGAALLLPESQLNAKSLLAHLRPLLDDRARLLEMAQRARDLARPEATRRLAEVCLEVSAHG